MRKRRFVCSLMHGPNNLQITRGIYIDETPYGAACKFIDQHFPSHGIDVSLRYEQPEHRPDGEIFSRWSAGTTASGQRIYIVEVDY